jgi:hypothetical protein
MLKFLNQIRQDQVNSIFNVSYCDANLKAMPPVNRALPYDGRYIDQSLMKVLLFDDKQDFERFLVSSGF